MQQTNLYTYCKLLCLSRLQPFMYSWAYFSKLLVSAKSFTSVSPSLLSAHKIMRSRPPSRLAEILDDESHLTGREELGELAEVDAILH